MAYDVEYASRNSKQRNLGILQYFYVMSSTMHLFFVSNMNQEHILSNKSKMAVRTKMADQNQIF
jgi:hypothetical protein